MYPQRCQALPTLINDWQCHEMPVPCWLILGSVPLYIPENFPHHYYPASGCFHFHLSDSGCLSMPEIGFVIPVTAPSVCPSSCLLPGSGLSHFQSSDAGYGSNHGYLQTAIHKPRRHFPDYELGSSSLQRKHRHVRLPPRFPSGKERNPDCFRQRRPAQTAHLPHWSRW